MTAPSPRLDIRYAAMSSRALACRRNLRRPRIVVEHISRRRNPDDHHGRERYARPNTSARRSPMSLRTPRRRRYVRPGRHEPQRPSSPVRVGAAPVTLLLRDRRPTARQRSGDLQAQGGWGNHQQCHRIRRFQHRQLRRRSEPDHRQLGRRQQLIDTVLGCLASSLEGQHQPKCLFVGYDRPVNGWDLRDITESTNRFAEGVPALTPNGQCNLRQCSVSEI